MRARLFLSLPLFICLLATSLAEEKLSPLKLNQMLKEELALAKTPALYFVFDLEEKSIQLKSRGLLLREWRIESVHSCGKKPLIRALTLVKKSALFAPKRKQIRPGETEQGDKFELDALELKDMPSTYVLYLSERIYLYIRPRPANLLSRLGSVGHLFSWYLWVPVRNLGFNLVKKPFGAIDVKLASKEDAQALYWSFSEGTKALIL